MDEEKLSRANRVFHRYFLQLFLALLYTFNAGNYTGTITEVLGTTGHFKNPFKVVFGPSISCWKLLLPTVANAADYCELLRL